MQVDIVADGLKFPEGPIVCSDGSVIVVEIARGTLTRVEDNGRTEVIAALGGGPNGAAVGPDGAIYVCNNGGFSWARHGAMLIPGHKSADHAGGSIQRVDLASGAVTILYEACDGTPLHAPNDIAFDSAGGMWFSDFGSTDARGRTHGSLLYAQPDGSAITRVRGELVSPNGVGLSPDEGTVYVADTYCQRLWAYDLAEPGVAAAPPPWMPARLVATLPGFQLLDSLAVLADGRICVGTMVEGGITVFSPDGATDHRPVDDIAITNIAFGGADMCDAWLTGSATGRLYRTRWDAPGQKLPFNL